MLASYTASNVERELRKHINVERANHSPRFFKAGPGEYAEGDQFLGVPVPYQRAIAKRFSDLPLAELENLLHSPLHECRLTVLLIMVLRMKKLEEQEVIVELYLDNLDYVNNWDLVDSSAPYILGKWLEKRDRKLLYTLAASNHLWKQRVAMVTTLAWIRKGDMDDALKLSETFLSHHHDLIHKATGWVLRECWKQDPARVRSFLDTHVSVMPRTMLRYAIELMDTPERKRYLAAPH